MTITEMRKYLEALEAEGYGDNIMRTTVTDSGKQFLSLPQILTQYQSMK